MSCLYILGNISLYYVFVESTKYLIFGLQYSSNHVFRPLFFFRPVKKYENKIKLAFYHFSFLIRNSPGRAQEESLSPLQFSPAAAHTKEISSSLARLDRSTLNRGRHRSALPSVRLSSE